VKHDFPVTGSIAPDGRAPRTALALQQRVGEQIDIRRQLAAMKITGFPGIFIGRVATCIEHVERVLPAVTTT
jgi:hypothetical protein